MTKPVINLADVTLREMGNGQGFAAKVGSFGTAIGSTGIGCMLHVVEPGQKAFPCHAHHQSHELFVILDGKRTYRFGDAEYPIRTGDVCAAPTGGQEVAHQTINTGSTVLKYLGLSTEADTEVAEHPDSGEIAVMSRFDWSTMSGGVRHTFHSGDPARDYFEGER